MTKKMKIRQIAPKMKIVEPEAEVSHESLEEEISEAEERQFTSFATGKGRAHILETNISSQNREEIDTPTTATNTNAEATHPLYQTRRSAGYAAGGQAQGPVYEDPMAAASSRSTLSAPPILRESGRNAISSNEERTIGNNNQIQQSEERDDRYNSLENRDTLHVKRRGDWRL